MKVSRRSAKKTIVAFLCSSALLLGACTVEQGSATDVGDKSSAAKASEAPKVNAPKASVKDGATGGLASCHDATMGRKVRCGT